MLRLLGSHHCSISNVNCDLLAWKWLFLSVDYLVCSLGRFLDHYFFLRTVMCASLSWTQHTQASQVTLCNHNTDDACTAIYVFAWTKCVILTKRWLVPWWWFPGKQKHVGAAFSILICFYKLHMCISWTIKGLISLMHGITIKIIEAGVIC